MMVTWQIILFINRFYTSYLFVYDKDVGYISSRRYA
jgi:hypothetical protein